MPTYEVTIIGTRLVIVPDCENEAEAKAIAIAETRTGDLSVAYAPVRSTDHACEHATVLER